MSKSSKRNCVLLTPREIHQELCKKPEFQRSKYELLGPNDKYRDENYAIYKAKCDEFRMKAKKLREANLKALKQHNFQKLGTSYINLPEQDEEEQQNVEQEMTKENEDKQEEVVIKKESQTSFEVIREHGTLIRKRYERYYNETWEEEEPQCFFEPWERRYSILCRFIEAARKVIIRNRLLRRLDILKHVTEDMILFYESEYIKHDHLSYGYLFQKFC